MGFVFAAGTPQSDTLIKNVKDYGAIGDGVTDDTAAIQAAIDDVTGDYNEQKRGTVFFPIGTYKVTSSILYESVFETIDVRYIEIAGEPGARVFGHVNGAIFKRSWNTPLGAIIDIHNLIVDNTHTTGIGIECHSAIGASIRNCHVTAHRAISVWGSQCATIDTCVCYWDSGTTLMDSIGIIAGNGCVIIDCDITGGFWHGVRHANLGLVILGGRFENASDNAIHLGSTYTGESFGSSGVFISGLSMEDNVVGIYIRGGSAISIQGCAITNVTDGQYGIRINAGNGILVSGCTIPYTGASTVASVSIEGGTEITFMSVIANASWQILGPPQGYQLINCDNPLLAWAQRPSNPRPGTIMSITDATATAIGAQVTAGGSTNDVVMISSTAGTWYRIA